MSYNHVSALLRVGKATLHRWVHCCNLPAPVKTSLPLPPVLEIDKMVASTPTTTLHRLRLALEAKGCVMCERRISKYLKRLGFSKKRTRRKCGGPPPVETTKAFHKELSRHFDEGRLIVSLDECYFSERVLPLTGYSRRGSPCIVANARGGWKQRSLLLAVASDGTKHHAVIDGGINRATFTSFVLGLPYPQGTTIVLDNLRVHKTSAPFVAKAFTALFTPPYSPEDNCPVENSFSKIKASFRSCWPWPGGVDRAIIDSTSVLTPSDVMRSFERLRRRCDAA